MIRLNIKKDSKVVVKSFIEKGDLITFIKNDSNIHYYDFKHVLDLTDEIWDLNVGTSLNIDGYTIAMAGKSRAGNIMLGGK